LALRANSPVEDGLSKIRREGLPCLSRPSRQIVSSSLGSSPLGVARFTNRSGSCEHIDLKDVVVPMLEHSLETFGQTGRWSENLNRCTVQQDELPESRNSKFSYASGSRPAKRTKTRAFWIERDRGRSSRGRPVFCDRPHAFGIRYLNATLSGLWRSRRSHWLVNE
jgi:hypothetical protein